MSKLIPIASYDLNHEAHLVKSFLESKGFDVYINDDLLGGQGYLAPTGGVKLLVPGEQVVQAKRALAEYVRTMNPVYCPNCGSENTAKADWSSLAFGDKFRTFFTGRSKYKCGDCDHSFSAEIV